MDPRERGEPLDIRAKGYSHLSAAVRKAACLQAMYNREEFRKSPMLAPIDPDQLAPLIRGFPDCLKPFTVETAYGRCVITLTTVGVGITIYPLGMNL